jgi:AcrR family transcriptional regulator
MALPPSEDGNATPGTPEAILEAARRRYARFGPRKTTMAEVAREAGCSRATLYSHFPGKEALYAGLLEDETRAFLGELEALVQAPTSARRKLRAIVEATLRSYTSSPVLGGAVAGDDEMMLERVARPLVAATEQRVIDLLREVLEDGVTEGSLRAIDAEAVAYLMYQLGRVLVVREVAGLGEFAFERILGAMDDLVARGIAKPGRPRRSP